MDLNQLVRKLVSIHASVKDATPEHLPKNEYGYVSIHASVKDATIVFCLSG